MTEKKVEKASRQAHILDDATQDLIHSIQQKDARFRVWFLVTWTVLLMVGIVGIYRQNQIATQGKQHIDCIVKLFTSKNRANKIIVGTADNCDIQTVTP